MTLLNHGSGSPGCAGIDAACATSAMVDRRRTLAWMAGAGIAAGLGTGLVPNPAAAASPTHYPDRAWLRVAPSTVGMDAARLEKAIAIASSKGGSGFVARRGWQVATWGDQKARTLIYSATKGFGSLLTELAMGDGLVKLSDRAQKWLPEFGTPPASNAAKGWAGEVTLEHLVSHTAGFAEPGSFQPILFKPGTKYRYSNAGANWLADVLTVRFAADLQDIFMRRIGTPIGITPSSLTWRPNLYRPKTLHGFMRREFASGVFITPEAFARIGLLMLYDGVWQGRRLLPAGAVRFITRPNPALAQIESTDPKEKAPLTRYWMLFSDNADGSFADLPHDTYMTWGKYENLMMVVPSLELVVVRLGADGFGDSRGTINGFTKGFIDAVTD